MREILFRGKRIDNGEWVYGYFFAKTRDEHPASLTTPKYFIKRETWYDGFDVFEIDENTLGQYTGLTDKNGTKIFEGDIVRLKETNYNYEWTAVVEFGNPNGEYIWGWNLRPITKDIEYNLDILCWVEMPIGATCEVIGNVWDTYELLKGE